MTKMNNYQQTRDKSTRKFDQNYLQPMFKAVGQRDVKGLQKMLEDAREAGSKGYSLAGHLYHTNQQGWLLFWLFTMGLLQYDFNMAQDIHSIASGDVRTSHYFSMPKAKQILTNTLKINDTRSIVQLMLSLRSMVAYALDFSKLMGHNRYGGTYHQLNDMHMMVKTKYSKAWEKPKYMDGLTLFFNCYAHIVLPSPLTDDYRALFSELIAITGSQNNLFKLYSAFFTSALGYVDFVPTTAFKNVNKKTFLMKLENDGEFVLENVKLMQGAYAKHFVLSKPSQAAYLHHNRERIRIESEILFRKKDFNKLIKQVG